MNIWKNHIGWWAVHPINGAHYGPFASEDEAAEWLINAP